MTQIPELWEAVPQPSGQWLIKLPSVSTEMAAGVIGTKCGRCIGIIAEENNARQIVACHNALVKRGGSNESRSSV